MKKHTLPKYILLALLSVSLLAGCKEETPYAEPETEPVEELVLSDRSAILSTGDSLTVTYTGGEGEVTFTSSDPEVASVDASGNIKALKKGNAMITAVSGSQTAKCGILVEPAGTLIDLTERKATEVFSQVQLFHPHEMIDFAADGEGGAFYFAQQYGQKMASDSMLTKVTQTDGVWERSEYVHLYNNGFGYFSIEKEDGQVYLLTESNGVGTNQGTTISRVAWEAGALYDEEFGDTYVLPGLQGSPRPESDVQNDLIVAYEFCGRESYYVIYDRDALMSGEENNYLHRFACTKRQTPVSGVDDSDGRYNSAIRGFAVKDGYIYQISGSGDIYISVFDFAGNLQYCHEVQAYEQLPGRAPGGISFSGDDLYIAVISANTTTVYYANVWKLEEAAE